MASVCLCIGATTRKRLRFRPGRKNRLLPDMRTLQHNRNRQNNRVRLAMAARANCAFDAAARRAFMPRVSKLLAGGCRDWTTVVRQIQRGPGIAYTRAIRQNRFYPTPEVRKAGPSVFGAQALPPLQSARPLAKSLGRRPGLRTCPIRRAPGRSWRPE